MFNAGYRRGTNYKTSAAAVFKSGEFSTSAVGNFMEIVELIIVYKIRQDLEYRYSGE